ICAMFIVSCDVENNGGESSIPSELVSGIVRNVNGTPLEGVGIHVIYEIEESAAICVVELTLFGAIPGNRQVALWWQTASERNNDHFNVQRRTEATDWTIIGQVEGSGNSQTLIDYEYIDHAVTIGETYFYRLSSVDYDGVTTTYEVTVSATPEEITEPRFSLYQNYPNPVLDTTKIHFRIMELTDVELIVQSMDQESIATLISTYLTPGVYDASFYTADLANGFYEYQIKADGFEDSRKLLKNTDDYNLLRNTLPGAETDRNGTYLFDVAIGDSVELRDESNQEHGAAALGRVTLVALKDGYLPADTTLDLTEKEHYTIDFTLQPE
ncbi:hypothetical protein KKG05_00200, partial [bacterium]|nr:hypothetical protein [bacterium]